MSLPPGARLGPYEILAPLGAGGMGEVYRARDTRLGRDVAVKILPPEVADDPGRRQRFELESRAVAALNHPNVVAIYDVGDGYIVSELVPGESLRGARFGLRKTLDIAAQIACGLAAAHDAGITHRDLKPENILLTREGRVKILDFGLAKMAASAAGAAATETLTVHTQAGVVLGTVGYMSPEQVRGQDVDHRSDIFSFGVVLYELLSGKRAFAAGSSVETMAAILKQDAPELPESIPAHVRRIVTHCLEKDPAQRFQSAQDLAFALESDVAGSADTVQAKAPQRTWRRALYIAAIVAVAAGSSFLTWRANRVELPQFRQVTFRRGSISGAAFAGDGKTIVYSASWDGKGPELFSTIEGSTESRPLGIANAHVAAISRKGEMALLLNPNPFLWMAPQVGTLARAAVSGGAPRALAENVIFADWSPDGSQLAIVRVVPGGEVLEYPIGKKLYQTAGQILMPRVSPKGDLIAFEETPLAWDGTGAVLAVDSSGQKRAMSRTYWGLYGLDWSPDGSEVWFIGGESGTEMSLLAADLSGKLRLKAHLPGFFELMGIASDGRVLLMHDSFIASMFFHRAGSPGETDLYWHDNSVVRDLSDDGKEIVFSEGGAASTKDWVTFIRETTGAPAVRLGEGFATALSPDAKWAMVNPTGPQAPLIALPTGAGVARTLVADNLRHVSGRWLPDGNRFVFVGAEPGHLLRYYVQTPGQPARPISPENIVFDRGESVVVSPDGRSLAIMVGDHGIELLPVEGGEPHPVAGDTNGLTPLAWCRNGDLLTYRPGEIPAHIVRIDPSSGSQRPWKELVPRDRTSLTLLTPIRFASDCETYAYSLQYDPSTLFVASGLQ
ncbi:MAG TPA: protein kinase [Bryobacteraceae bacterium]|nr:protein kinase [Bryobacteraceae bacterium]